MVDRDLGKHGVVLKLSGAERWSVSGNDDKLSLSGADGLEGRLIAEGVLARLDNKCETGVD